jgi:hypothetical protein
MVVGGDQMPRSSKRQTKKTGTAKAPRRKKKTDVCSLGFGHLVVPDDVKITDSCLVEGDDVDESMDVWWGWDEEASEF